MKFLITLFLLFALLSIAYCSDVLAEDKHEDVIRKEDSLSDDVIANTEFIIDDSEKYGKKGKGYYGKGYYGKGYYGKSKGYYGKSKGYYGKGYYGKGKGYYGKGYYGKSKGYYGKGYGKKYGKGKW